MYDVKLDFGVDAQLSNEENNLTPGLLYGAISSWLFSKASMPLKSSFTPFCLGFTLLYWATVERKSDRARSEVVAGGWAMMGIGGPLSLPMTWPRTMSASSMEMLPETF